MQICTNVRDRESLHPLVEGASFGANRNSYGNSEIRFPLFVEVAEGNTRPQLRARANGTTLVLPAAWGVWAFTARSLNVEAVRATGEIIRFDGDNFIILIGQAGELATVVADSYEKNGKWSKTLYHDFTFRFAHRRSPAAPYNSGWHNNDVPIFVEDYTFSEKSPAEPLVRRTETITTL